MGEGVSPPKCVTNNEKLMLYDMQSDGIDVINFNLGYKYPSGLFVVQDGTNDGKNKVKRQNFKYVSFADVLKKLDL